VITSETGELQPTPNAVSATNVNPANSFFIFAPFSTAVVLASKIGPKDCG
jgi:hypothetical protein